MKKLIILFAAAVAVGVLISQFSGNEAEQPDSDSAENTDPDTEMPASDSAAAPPTQGLTDLESADQSKDTESSRPKEADEKEGQDDKKEEQDDEKEEQDDEKEEQNDEKEEPSDEEDNDGKDEDESDGSEESARDGAGTADTEDIQQADQLLEEDKPLEARQLLTRVYLNGDEDERQKAREMLEEINQQLVFNPEVLEGTTVHTVKPGETLQRIGKQHDVSWRLVQRLNHIERPERIRVGQKLKILTGPARILVRKSEFCLALFIDGHFIKEYPVGLGKKNKTPTRTFEVSEMLIKPDWYPPDGGMIEYGEEGHLIGERWIGFSDEPGAAGFGIHGTNDPDSIGSMASNGCIRMHNDDVRELYDFVTTGTKVEIKE